MSRQFGKVLNFFSLQLLQLLDYINYQIASVHKLQKQIALHQQILDDDAPWLQMLGM